MLGGSIDRALETQAGVLSTEFQGTFAPETVRTVLQESFDTLPEGPIATYRPPLATRFARERLRAVAQTEGKIPKDAPEILYVCVHNAGRSQMAAALTAKLGKGRVNVRSAGSTPAREINPTVVLAMAEIGVDLSEAFAKPLTDEVVKAADVVITMGCGDACPVYPGKRYLDWAVDDPAGMPIQVVRTIRDQIELRVRQLLQELGVL